MVEGRGPLSARARRVALRATLLFLAAFDLTTGVMALLWPRWVIAIAALDALDVPGAMYRAGPIEPLFVRGVGLLWVLAAYVQVRAFVDLPRDLVATNVAIVFRALGASFNAFHAAYVFPHIGYDHTLFYWVEAVFVGGDVLALAAMLLLLRSLGLRVFHLPRGGP